MNPYVAFALRSFGAFISGLGANATAHAVVLKTETDWFILILSGLAAMTAYWSGVLASNPFTSPPKP